jgi:hypothetical protein
MALQDKYQQDFVQLTPEFMTLFDSTVTMLISEIEQLKP